MVNIALRTVWFCLLSLVICIGYSPALVLAQRETISLSFQHTPASIIINALAKERPQNILLSPELDKPVTVELNQVSWEQALNALLLLIQGQAHYQGDLLIITPMNIPSNVKINLPDDKSTVRLPSREIALSHRQVESAVELLDAQRGRLFSTELRFSIDKSSNRLLFQADEQDYLAIRAFAARFDSPQPQIEIRAHIVNINHERLKELGVQWGLSGQLNSPNVGQLNQFTVGLPLPTHALQASLNIARLDSRILELELTALELEEQAKIIASPRLVALNRHLAQIKQGTEIPYEVATGTNGATAIEFKSAVLGLEVTPTLLSKNEIELALTLSQNVPGRSIKRGNGGEILTIDTQEIRTHVVVGNNETLILGGIIQKSQTGHITKVPLFGDIPLVGSLFRRESARETQRELIIFITPSINNVTK